MGLLDDAIREHLDLKRRRGADPAEIERAEREALGPVRRNFDESADLADPDLVAVEDLDGTDDDWHESVLDEQRSGRSALARDYDELDKHTPTDWDEEERFSPDAPPGQASAGSSPPPAPGLEAETAEYDVSDESHHDADDVLEETPDFLQDTPDHDRLWFEQRPPRDFDFDG